MGGKNYLIKLGKMLINLSNHPSTSWKKEQLKAAQDQYGQIIDWLFPTVDAHWSSQQITQLADTLLKSFKSKCNPADATVHIMGEMTLTFALVHRLQRAGFSCIASCSHRSKDKNEFKFIRFRAYSL